MLTRSGSTSVTGWWMDQIAASVAPPRATTRREGTCARIASGSVTGIQSPESSARRIRPVPRAGPVRRYSWSIWSWAGTEFHRVTACSSARAAQWAGSPRSPASGRTSAPPTDRGPKMSYTDRSKPRWARPRIRSSGPTAKRWLMSSTVLRAAAWVIITPFGVPVEPEV
ncbi:hypothetical protein GA0115247_11692 [Streptomyces sp. PalvLS-984]|nr:hypothetical protein GA0115247_11692 [Streptomyces sp. PalvLS-984]